MDTDELAQALRDERAQRLAATRRVARLEEHLETWRERAEERAARIEQLQARLDVPWVRRAARSLRRGLRDDDTERAAPTVTVPAATPDRRPHRTPPLYPTVACVDLTATDRHAPVLAELRTTATVDAATLAAADLVVVDESGPAGLDPAARAALDEWIALPGRAPLVHVGGGPVPLPGHVVSLGDDLHAFDPRAHNPGAPAPDLRSVAEVAAGDGVELDPGRPGLVAAADLDRLWTNPPGWFLELAGQGRAGWRPDVDPTRGGAAARRVAVRRFGSWVAAGRLLEAAGVAAPRRDDRVAAILVSNRPDRVVEAARRIGRTQQVDLEVVIGLHGVAPPAGLAAAVAALDRPVTVLELPGTRSLGACLNECIAATSAPVLAKVDDDDHYGPHHLEDGLQALRYSGADLVGKGTQFTYVAGADRTVLRRPRSEETLLDGTPTGASWVVRRSLWEQVRFPHRPRRVDELFLAGARALGATVYANSRWEFCYVRGGDGHTWTADDETFLAGAAPAWDGHEPQQCELDEGLLLPAAALG